MKLVYLNICSALLFESDSLLYLLLGVGIDKNALTPFCLYTSPFSREQIVDT